ncbi:hypothetical protein FHG66_21200 [Rubellimicrobium rubrum]|uniref:Uncharacterized protein n=1 Tax=Rubellimicrobium rubrum TaxID=2585369 RepID=A0A5C4MK44_9RHOB|nr:hypothetical protein FHG66_21200 [Rubellimicrobium rubrum]
MSPGSALQGRYAPPRSSAPERATFVALPRRPPRSSLLSCATTRLLRPRPEPATYIPPEGDVTGPSQTEAPEDPRACPGAFCAGTE